MIGRELHIHRQQFDSEVLPRLVGRVFHVTTPTAFSAIVATGEIKPNNDAAFRGPFGGNSFFRRRGCVSLFDLRCATAAQLDKHLPNCHPLQVGDHIVFLFIAETAWSALVPWTRWQEEEALSETLVPYVECGHQGAIPLSAVEEIMTVITDDPLDPLVEALLRNRRDAAAQKRGGLV